MIINHTVIALRPISRMSCIECHPAIPHGSCSLTPCILTDIIIQAQNIVAATQSSSHSNGPTSTWFLRIIIKILILIGTWEIKSSFYIYFLNDAKNKLISIEISRNTTTSPSEAIFSHLQEIWSLGCTSCALILKILPVRLALFRIM